MSTSDEDIEEERRLFYVGMTRAKDELFLTYARERSMFGRRVATQPSLFLNEIPEMFMGEQGAEEPVQGPEKEADEAVLRRKLIVLYR